MEIDHIIPLSQGGPTQFQNLCLACTLCNNFKQAFVSGIDPESGQLANLFNPRTHRWGEHFRWSPAGDYIFGITAVGRVTVITLKMNRLVLVTARRYWIEAGWHPPKD